MKSSLKSTFSLALISMNLFSAMNVYSQTATIPSGSGTPGDPYLISSLENLYWLSQSDTVWDDNAWFLQTADIDASPTAAWDDNAGFSPIGSVDSRFNGTYEGQGYSITGLTINRPTERELGLFGATQNARIDSLNLVELNFIGLISVGGLVGDLNTTDISYIYTSGTITVDQFGGSSRAGGIAGTGAGNQQHLVSSVHITANGDQVGGIFGNYSNGVLTDSYATGNISGTTNVGGLIGGFEFTGSGEALHRVYATGDVSGTQRVGGLIGISIDDVVITNSFATGSVLGSSNSGGFIGIVQGNGTISNSYASGTVFGGFDTGAFIGQNDGNVTNSYWNTQTSGRSNGIGTDTNGQTVTGLTVQEMAQQGNFSGFDFSGTWGMVEIFSKPYLQFNAPDSVNGIAVGDFPSGTGTEGDPILISNLTHLEALSQSSSAWGSVFLQTADIDASATSGWNSGAGFIPIGESLLPFKGNYDGGGNEISNLFINRPSDDNIGFFGVMDSATISNIGLVKADVTGSSFTGILAGGANTGSVFKHVYSTGSVHGGADTGGLIGNSQADSVYQAFSTADVTSGENTNGTGGLIGFLSGVLTDSYASGSVYGSFWVGGLVGLSVPSAVVSNSYSTGSVGGSDSDFGGLIGGVFGSTISDSYWNTDLSGQSIAFGDGSGDATGLSTAQMIDSTSFLGFDFSESGAWNMDDSFSFPYLRALEEHRIVVATIDSVEGLPAGQAGWRMIGHPGDITYAEFLDPIYTEGYEGSDGGTGFDSNVLFYEEGAQTFTAPSSANDFFGTADSTTENTALNGILLYVYGDDDGDGNEDSWPKYLVSENSTLNQSFDVSLGYTNDVSADSAGWNLISNPYPVSLDWTELVTNNDITNTFPVVYIWDDSLNAGNGAYRINYGYPLPSGLPQDLIFEGPIPAVQAFWVKAFASGASLDIKPSQQAASRQLLKQPRENQEEETGWLSLTVSSGDFSDQLVLFTSDAYKAPKLGSIAGRYTEISIVDDEQSWTATSLAGLEAEEQVSFPIHLSTTETGNFDMEWDGLDSFDADWTFELTDHLTGETIDLNNASSYEFELTTDSAAKKSPLEKPVLNSIQEGFRGVSTAKAGKVESTSTRFELHITTGTSVSNEPEDGLPTTYSLAQNYPNPFNPSTSIRFELPQSGNVELLVFDILGRQVANLVDDRMEAGYHIVQFNAANLASGVYLYQLRAGNSILTKKLTLIK